MVVIRAGGSDHTALDISLCWLLADPENPEIHEGLRQALGCSGVDDGALDSSAQSSCVEARARYSGLFVHPRGSGSIGLVPHQIIRDGLGPSSSLVLVVRERDFSVAQLDLLGGYVVRLVVELVLAHDHPLELKREVEEPVLAPACVARGAVANELDLAEAVGGEEPLEQIVARLVDELCEAQGLELHLLSRTDGPNRARGLGPAEAPGADLDVPFVTLGHG